MDDSQDDPSNESVLTRRTALRTVAGLAGTATVGTLGGSAAGEYIRPPGGGGGGSDENESFDTMVSYAEDYDQGAWEFKITLTTALNYYGSYEIDSGATNTNYRHEFDLMMNANALQREYGDEEWEPVDPEDGTNSRWVYQLDQGNLAVEASSYGEISLTTVQDETVTAFSPGRGAPGYDWDVIKEYTADEIVSRVADEIPLASQALTASEILAGLSSDGAYDPDPLEEDNRREFPMNYQGVYNLPSQVDAYFDFAVVTYDPCQSFDIDIEADFQIQNDGDRHRELEPVSIRETYTNDSSVRTYHTQDVDVWCD